MNLLKEARSKKNWTQEQAALALDVTQAYLSMMEKGRRPLSARFVRKALKVLKLNNSSESWQIKPEGLCLYVHAQSTLRVRGP